MWIITVLFITALWLAHIAVGTSDALKLHISEMRPLTVFAHFLFLLLIGAALFLHAVPTKSVTISAWG